MSTESNLDNVNLDDLDLFSNDFFGQKESPEGAANPSVTEDPEDTSKIDNNAPTLNPEGDDPEDINGTEGDEGNEPSDPEPVDKPAGKKNRFQERIDELTGKIRSGERDREALLERIAKLEEKQAPVQQKQPTINEGPQPDDVAEDGSDKYPLGELDPQYIRDLTRHTLKVEREAMLREEAERASEAELQKEKTKLQEEWNAKLGPAQERYPDFRERGEKLLEQFSDLEPKYGEYLAAVLMSMDHGTDVLYYLASNPDEARAIVQSNATKATLTLGRLEAQFAALDNKPTTTRPKVTKAPQPPAHINKGSALASAEVADDTDDLDAFASKFFKKR